MTQPKKGRGRPRVVPFSELAHIAVYVTQDEGELIHRAAERAGLSTSKWVRSVVLPIARYQLDKP